MTVIENQTIGKHDQATCEDATVVTADFAAVVDGSTSKGRQLLPTMRNGRYARNILCDVVRSLAPNASMLTFARQATKAFRDEYERLHADIIRMEQHPEDRLCASVVIYSSCRHEVWMIGDCQCLIDGRLYDNPKHSEAEQAEKRSQLARELLNSGVTIPDLQHDDRSRTAILPMMVESMKEENIGYSVVDGFPIPMDKTIMISCPHAHEIVLATDGYPFLKPTLKESEQMLEKQLNDDPLNIKSFKATKGLMAGNVSFDDRAYLRLKV